MARGLKQIENHWSRVSIEFPEFSRITKPFFPRSFTLLTLIIKFLFINNNKVTNKNYKVTICE